MRRVRVSSADTRNSVGGMLMGARARGTDLRSGTIQLEPAE
jgi:hypothetical protein